MGMMGLLGVGGGGGIVGPTYATLDGTPTNATLSGGNLIAAHTNSSVGGARSNSVKTTGLYYFEVTLTHVDNAFSNIAILKSTGAYTDPGVGASNCTTLFFGGGGGLAAGVIYANSSPSGSALGTLSNGDVIGVAVDFTHSTAWYRKAPSGNWNGSGTANPATNTGGVTIGGAIASGASAGPALCFQGDNLESYTANFGASAFSGSVPSGFTSGWPP